MELMSERSTLTDLTLIEQRTRKDRRQAAPLDPCHTPILHHHYVGLVKTTRPLSA